MSRPPTDRVPDRVPTVSPRGPRADARRLCPPSPSSSMGDTVSEPPRPCPATVSQPYFQHDEIQWHYPDPNHPSTRDFPRAAATRINNPCPTCGAPPRAACVTKHGKPISGRHTARAQAGAR